ncbi:toll/interleukin-1 receptor domain-containing protein [Mesorhizobium sp.]|uniref:toll/interleukin-1 receptor domain-containing protein n=1 Tax=Mesorhizobium sp. TaxID=1871066 RepID=UPI0025FFDF8C|nr:toll/interleukin-1 receptor domain-containing protein [Mesorhizobium sp.]
MRRLPSDPPALARRLDILQGRIDDGSIEPWMAVMLAEQIRQRAARSEPLACEDHVARAEIESLLLDPNMLDIMKAQVDGPWDVYATQADANRQAANLATALLELSGEQSLHAGPTTPDSDETGGPMQQRQHGRRFDVAVSCAGPDRQFVREVVQRLLRAGLAVYYDDSESNQAWMVGRNLEEATLRIYREESSCCAVFLSTHYAASRWTRAELAAALERNAGDSGYVRPVRLDDTVFSEIPPALVYLDARAGRILSDPVLLSETLLRSLRRSEALPVGSVMDLATLSEQERKVSDFFDTVLPAKLRWSGEATTAAKGTVHFSLAGKLQRDWLVHLAPPEAKVIQLPPGQYSDAEILPRYLRIRITPREMAKMLAGEIDTRQALISGTVEIAGDKSLLGEVGRLLRA